MANNGGISFRGGGFETDLGLCLKTSLILLSSDGSRITGGGGGTKMFGLKCTVNEWFSNYRGASPYKVKVNLLP